MILLRKHLRSKCTKINFPTENWQRKMKISFLPELHFHCYFKSWNNYTHPSSFSSNIISIQHVSFSFVASNQIQQIHFSKLMLNQQVRTCFYSVLYAFSKMLLVIIFSPFYFYPFWIKKTFLFLLFYPSWKIADYTEEARDLRNLKDIALQKKSLGSLYSSIFRLNKKTTILLPFYTSLDKFLFKKRKKSTHIL